MQYSKRNTWARVESAAGRWLRASVGEMRRQREVVKKYSKLCKKGENEVNAKVE